MKSERKLWVLSALTFVVLASAISASLWLLVSGTFIQRCSDTLSLAIWDRCTQGQNFALDRAALLASVVGISISAVGTIALFITIIYTARATNAATEAAKSAKAALDIAKQSQLLELRPYVNVVGLSHAYHQDSSGKVISRNLRLTWENVGNTPALNCHTTLNHCIIDGQIPSDFPFEDQTTFGTYAGTIGKDKQVTTGGATISLDDVKSVINETKKLHAWGWFEYEGFDGRQRYRTEYHASALFYLSDDPADKNLGFWFTISNDFNGSDDTCKYMPKTPLAARKRRAMTKAAVARPILKA